MEINTFYFEDGIFTFWTATYGSWANDARIVFRVRLDVSPQDRAKQKKIANYDRLLPATSDEIEKWLKYHPTYPLRDERVFFDMGTFTYSKIREMIAQTAGEWV